MNIDDCVITTRRNQGGVLDRHMRRAWGRALNHNTFVYYIAVGVSCYTDSNCLLLRCLIGQHKRIIIHFDIFIYTVVEFHSFMVCNRRLGWGQKRCSRILCFRWRGSTSHLVVVDRNISCWNVHSCVDWRWYSW